MNDEQLVTLVRESAPQTDSPHDAEARARARLYAEVRREVESGAPRTTKERARRSRLRWSVAGASLCATAVAVAVVASQIAGPGMTDPGRAGPSHPVTSTTGTPHDIAGMSVGQAMELAANTVERQDQQKPGPHQWIYTRIVSDDDTPEEQWFRFDGEWYAEVAEIDGEKRLQEMRVYNGRGERTPAEDYDFFADLPTDPDALRQRLYEDSQGTDGGGDADADERAFENVYDIFEDDPLMPPENRAALYRAIATIPGVTVDDDAVDEAGRHGIAVTRDQGKVTLSIILAKDDFRVLGQTAKSAEFESSWAIVTQAVVDDAGQRP